jgi:hypothetical protein
MLLWALKPLPWCTINGQYWKSTGGSSLVRDYSDSCIIDVCVYAFVCHFLTIPVLLANCQWKSVMDRWNLGRCMPLMRLSMSMLTTHTQHHASSCCTSSPLFVLCLWSDAFLLLPNENLTMLHCIRKFGLWNINLPNHKQCASFILVSLYRHHYKINLNPSMHFEPSI